MKIISALTAAQLRMYLRDRQSVILSLFFPLLLMFAFGFLTQSVVLNYDLAIVADDPSPEAERLFAGIDATDVFTVTRTDETAAREGLAAGTFDLALLVPPTAEGETLRMDLLSAPGNQVAAAQALGLFAAISNVAEHQIRGTTPIFAFAIESQGTASEGTGRYIEFLVPGLLAFMILQLAIAGSAFNIVEYKRKGIIRRLFVTPLSQLQFITSLISMRLITILVQMALLIAFAYFVFGVSISGNPLLFFVLVLVGAIMFLALGFVLGGIAKTQNAVILFGNLFIFPQVFLASVFFSLDTLPNWLSTVAGLLPLNFLAVGMREVATNGAGLDIVWPQLVGLLVWGTFGIVLASRVFRWGDAAVD